MDFQSARLRVAQLELEDLLMKFNHFYQNRDL